MERTRQVVSLATLIGIVLLALATVLLAGSASRLMDSWRWVVHTREVLDELGAVALHVTRAESAQRGYMLTRNPLLLQQYDAQSTQALQSVDQVRDLTTDNPVQQRRIPELREATARRLARLGDVARRPAGQPVDLAAEQQAGMRLMGQVESVLAQMRTEEERLLGAREDQVTADSRRMLLGVSGLAVLSVCLLVALRWTARRDLRNLARAHASLLEANATLEERVAERTLRLEQANAQLDSFARTVAHDLRSPLRNIEGFAEALMEDEPALSREGRDYLQRIMRGSGRMDRLVTELLAYSRLSKEDLPVGPVALDAVWRAAVEAEAAAIAATRASVQVQPGMPGVLANQAALVQVAANLLGNAVKFVAPGVRPLVQVGAQREGARVRIDVRDNGIGIPAAQQERIFGVFERLHPQERYDGTGIGLAIVRQAVERMGGRVAVRSQPGEGSVFSVWLPAAPPAVEGG